MTARRGRSRIRCSAMAAALACVVVSAAPDFSGEAPASLDLRAELRTVPDGATVRVPPGVHQGPLILDRPVTLIGEPGAVIDGGGRGDVIRIEAPDVTIRGLEIRNTGISLDRENSGVAVLAGPATIEHNDLRDVLFGIYLKGAPGSVIRGNRIEGKALPVQRRGDAIRLWHSRDVLVEDNRVHDSRDVVVWFSDGVTLRGNHIERGRYGLHFMYSNSNVVVDNELRDNSVGAFLMYSKELVVARNVLAGNRGPSGYGIGLKDMDGVEATGNTFLGNRIGIYLDDSPSSVDVHDHFSDNVLAYNDVGVAFQPSVRRNVFVGNAFIENLEQAAVLDGGELRGNQFTVGGRGNSWSDYQGYDLDGDGIGDLPYRSASLFENLMDRHPKLRLFLYSPAQQAVELAANALPVVRPRRKFEDSAPLMRPPVRAPADLSTRTSRYPMALLAAGLLLGSLLIVGHGGRGGGVAPHRGARATRDETGVPMILVEKLTKRYGHFTAVRDLNLELRHGEALALWGRNGAGKTTVIRCLLGLTRCDGRIFVGGSELRRHGKLVRQTIGYVPQELAFYDDMTALGCLNFFAAIKRVPAERCRSVIREVGLEAHERKRVSEMSGGMKQRLALAAALLADPPLLLLDEMTSNLDAKARSDFLARLARLKRAGKTMLFTSHRLDEVEALADRVLVMSDGEVTLECPGQELAAALGLGRRLKLIVAPDQIERAAATLRERGFDPRRNGSGLWVRVAPHAKLAPVEALLAARIRPGDFDLATDDEEGPS